MSFAPKSPILFALLAIPALAAGCGGNKAGEDPEVLRRKSELAEIHEIYTSYLKRYQRPPKQLSDLNQKEYQPIYPVGFQALQEGKYVVVWGTSAGGKESGTVLAYEKDAPKQGGVVLMADGAVKNMSADELRAAVKAKE